MTRTVIGGIAAGAFTLGILAGLVIPGTLAASRHDQLMASHWSAMGSTPMVHIPSMPMMDSGSMPMVRDHAMHHASWELGR